ncbi:MAG: hypothetical protein ACTSUE_01865 [Promethearchaeota archaeon]
MGDIHPTGTLPDPGPCISSRTGRLRQDATNRHANSKIHHRFLERTPRVAARSRIESPEMR